MDELSRVEKTRLVLPSDDADLRPLGAGVDRAARNRLQGRWLVGRCARWIENGVELHRTDRPAPQGTMVLRDAGATPRQVVSGAFSFDTGGLGIAPSNPFGLIQAPDDLDECTRLRAWFDQLWSGLRADVDTRAGVVAALRAVAADRDPLGVYVPDPAPSLRGARRRTGRGAGRQVRHGNSQDGGLAKALQVPARWRGRRHRQARPFRRLHHRRQRGSREDLRGRWPLSITTSCGTTACWCCVRSGCATTGS